MGIILDFQRILTVLLTEVQEVAVTNLHLHLRQDVGELWIVHQLLLLLTCWIRHHVMWVVGLMRGVASTLVLHLLVIIGLERLSLLLGSISVFRCFIFRLIVLENSFLRVEADSIVGSLLVLVTRADLVRSDAILGHLPLLIEATAINFRHLLIPPGLCLAHAAPCLLQMLHDLLGAPLLVDHFEDFALLLREENERTEGSLGRISPHVQRHAVIAHVRRDVLLSPILVHLLKLVLRHADQGETWAANLCLLRWLIRCTSLLRLFSSLFYLLRVLLG